MAHLIFRVRWENFTFRAPGLKSTFYRWRHESIICRVLALRRRDAGHSIRLIINCGDHWSSRWKALKVFLLAIIQEFLYRRYEKLHRLLSYMQLIGSLAEIWTNRSESLCDQCFKVYIFLLFHLFNEFDALKDWWLFDHLRERFLLLKFHDLGSNHKFRYRQESRFFDIVLTCWWVPDLNNWAEKT